MSAYKGESPGKKMARMKHWQAVLHGVRDRADLGWTNGIATDLDECPEMRVLVLASAEGGDIATLKALGVRPSQIVACDIDRDAAEACKRRHPDVRIEVGDVGDVALSLTDLYAAFLDFCGQSCPSYLATAVRVASALPDRGGILSVGVMRGRESDVGTITTRINRSTRRRMSAMGASDLANGRWSGKTRRKELGVENRFDVSRSLLWQEALRISSGSAWTLMQVWNYHSAVNGGGGVPMAISTFMSGPTIAAVVARGGVRIQAETVRADEAGIRRAALNVEGAAARLNVPSRTVAAWRAHETMGTYENQECKNSTGEAET